MSDAGDSIFEDPNALPAGTRFGELEIIRTLGVGGFGIVYLAQDHALERRVAVKEYMPAQLAQRGDAELVSVRSAQHRETFELGLRSFVNEARLLARFDHPSLLKVYRFWEANGTAYMVMPYLLGKTLKRIRDGLADAPSENWILKQALPLLDALNLLHEEKVYHRDISPDNILLPPDGGDPILLDFGAARRVIGDRTQTFTAIFKPSYAPIEQYGETTQLRQGPWTDIYALGAVLHFLLTGMPPPLATTRAVIDEFVPLASRDDWPGHSRHFRAAIDWALAVRPADRPRTVGELRKALLGERTMPLVKSNEEQGLDPDATIRLERPKLPPKAAPSGPSAVPGDAFAPTQLVAAPRPAVEAVPVPSDSGRTQPQAPAPGYERTQPRTQPGVLTPEENSAPAAAPKPARSARRPPPAVAVDESPPSVAGRQRLWLGLGLGGAAVLLAGFWWLLQGRQAPAGPEGLVVSIEPSEPASGAASGPPMAALPAASALPDPMPPVAAASLPPAPAAASAVVPPVANGGRQFPVRPAAAQASKPAVATAPPPRPIPRDSRPAESVEPPRAEAPVPAQPSRPAGPLDPRAACGDRVLFALWRCMEQRCEEPAYAEHAECRQLAEQRERRREMRNR